MFDVTVLIRGAGDLATGVAVRLHNSGFRVIMLETSEPTVIRRTVSFAQCVFDKEYVVEGIKGVMVCCPQKALEEIEKGNIPVLADSEGKTIDSLHPDVVVDAILAKKNTGTNKNMAPLTIGLGPGFEAGKDVDYVVETMRGHDLGRVFSTGKALANTGVPGIIGGFGAQRVMHSPADGVFHAVKKISDIVKKGDILGYVDTAPLIASLDGVLRGILQDGLKVKKGLKMADIDPRPVQKHCFTVSDKARALGGSVLEIICLRFA